MIKLSACGAGLIAIWIVLSPVHAQPLEKKVQNDETLGIAGDDPGMADAMRRARETLPDFLTLLSNAPPAVEHMAVKIALQEKNNEHMEFVWIGNLRQTGENFSGIIGNRVIWMKSYKQGGAISFKKSDIVDWTYRDKTGKKGNYTSCALLARENPAEAEKVIKQLKLDCSWMGK